MYFDGGNVAGPSTCKRCGHKERGIDLDKTCPPMPPVKAPKQEEWRKLVEWLLSDDTGTSSLTIVSVMTGVPLKDRYPDTPHDAHDLDRCVRLLKRFPAWRSRLHEVAEVYPRWAALVREWDELERMRNQGEKGLFERMLELIRECNGYRSQT